MWILSHMESPDRSCLSQVINQLINPSDNYCFGFHIWRHCPSSILRIYIFLLLEQREHIKMEKGIHDPHFWIIEVLSKLVSLLSFLWWTPFFSQQPERSLWTSVRSHALPSLETLQWLSEMKSEMFVVLYKARNDLVYAQLSNISTAILSATSLLLWPD